MRGEGKGGEQKRHGKKDRRHARRESGRGAEEGENGFTRQSLSGRPRENHNARLPSSRRPSSSFCPPVRSSVCLPVHPFVSSSASCHSPRQPSDGSPASEIHLLSCPPPGSPFVPSLPPQPPACYYVLFYCQDVAKVRPDYLPRRAAWRHCHRAIRASSGIFAKIKRERDNRARVSTTYQRSVSEERRPDNSSLGYPDVKETRN